MSCETSKNSSQCEPSASELLNRYISSYEDNSVLHLARDMTNICTTTPLRRHNIKLKEPSVVDDEIKMAQQLLAKSLPHTADTSLASTTADHLLVSKVEPDLKILNRSFQSVSSMTSTSLSRKRSNRRRRENLHQSDESCFYYDSDGSVMSESSLNSYFPIPLSPESFILHPKSSISLLVEDLKRTKRLIDDLKADYMSPDVSFGGTRRPPNDALYDLITRLTVAARRKEEKIARLMGKDVTSNSDADSDTDFLASDSSKVSSPFIISCSSDSDSIYNAIRCSTSQRSMTRGKTRRYNKRSKISDLSSMNTTSSLLSRIKPSINETSSAASESTVSKPVPVSRSTPDCFAQNDIKLALTSSPSYNSSRLTGRHGSIVSDESRPVEALKSMISTLQHVSLDSAGSHYDDIGHEDCHGSLNRAMSHLEILKKIIRK